MASWRRRTWKRHWEGGHHWGLGSIWRYLEVGRLPNWLPTSLGEAWWSHMHRPEMEMPGWEGPHDSEAGRGFCTTQCSGGAAWKLCRLWLADLEVLEVWSLSMSFPWLQTSSPWSSDQLCQWFSRVSIPLCASGDRAGGGQGTCRPSGEDVTQLKIWKTSVETPGFGS